MFTLRKSFTVVDVLSQRANHKGAWLVKKKGIASFLYNFKWKMKGISRCGSGSSYVIGLACADRGGSGEQCSIQTMLVLGLFQSRRYTSSMKSTEVLRVLTDVTASQWGMLTAAQASALGVTRLALSRLADGGHLERLAHGVYRDAGAPSDEFEDLRAAWLSTEPKLRAEQRLGNLADGVVVASSSAALLHGIGDMWANRHEFVTSKRRQTQRAEIRYRQRHLDSRDVTLTEGLPAMTLERTLADLLDDVGEMSLVADALSAAARKRSLDLDRLRELLGPLAERNGFKRHDGNAVLDQLLEVAGLDLDSAAHRILEDPELRARVLAKYFGQVAAREVEE